MRSADRNGRWKCDYTGLDNFEFGMRLRHAVAPCFSPHRANTLLSDFERPRDLFGMRLKPSNQNDEGVHVSNYGDRVEGMLSLACEAWIGYLERVQSCDSTRKVAISVARGEEHFEEEPSLHVQTKSAESGRCLGDRMRS
jgi:hypothetical protein